MQIKAVIHEKYKDLELHICKNELDSEVRNMAAVLREFLAYKISATDEKGNRVILNSGEIITFYAEEQRIYALDKHERYTVSKKLYELEKELDSSRFIRISKSEIINYTMIKCMDMSMSGTIKLTMKNGYETFTSRRNVAKIKKMLIKEEKR